MKIAVLLTSFNRKQFTLLAIARLQEQKLPPLCSLHVILVDDASTDGTKEAVESSFPDVHLIIGSGQLFWNGGMRTAIGAALQGDADALLLLNDDTFLQTDAITRMTNQMLETGPDRNAIVIGAVKDPVSNVVNYGGWKRTGGLSAAKVARLEGAPDPQVCDTFNGNCVLIGRPVFEKLGNLDPRFTHGMGDFDFGFRAAREGINMVVAPGIVGECQTNTGSGLWTDVNLPLLTRWKLLLGPKGLPVTEWRQYCARHGGALWPFLWVKPYVQFWIAALIRPLVEFGK